MAPGLKSLVAASGERGIVGYVVDPEELERRFVVELRLDGWPVRVARANLLDPALAAEGVGDGCFGFRFILDEAAARAGGAVEVVLANSDVRLGEPTTIGGAPRADVRDGAAIWTGGLRFSGWVGEANRERSPTLRALIDGETVAEARADRWTALSEVGGVAPARSFELNLPELYADGRARHVRIVDESGRDLPGSPVAFLAFADGLERFLVERADLQSERPRGAVYDALFPRSHPMRDFAGWRRRFPTPAPELGRRPRAAVALLGEGDIDASAASLQGQQGAGWVAGVLAGVSAVDLPAGALASFLAEDAGDADFVVFAPAGAIFDAQALARFADAFARFPEAAIVYGDASFLAPGGEEWPLAFPAFDYERMLEQGYAALCFAARRAHVEEVQRKGAPTVFDLFLAALSVEKPADCGRIAHTPGFLVLLPEIDLAAASEALASAVAAHFSARGAKVETAPVFSARLPAVRVMRRIEPAKLTIVAAARSDAAAAENFLHAVFETVGAHNVDVLIVDMGSRGGPDDFDELVGERVRIARMAGPCCPERAFNMGATLATSDCLLFADVGMTPPRAGWIDEVLGRLVEPWIGAVAPTLLWRSGLVQQSGLVVGPDFAVARAFADHTDGELGYGEALAATREAAAASALGLVVKRRVFLELGGFDLARYPLRLSAADYGLRLRASGRRLIVAPRAKWTVSRVSEAPREGEAEIGDRARRELETFRTRWAATLAADSLYSPLLTLSGAPYSGLAWPPRPLEPRLPEIQPPREWPAGA